MKLALSYLNLLPLLPYYSDSMTEEKGQGVDGREPVPARHASVRGWAFAEAK